MNITNSVVIVCAPSGREPQIFRNDPPQNIRNLQHREPTIDEPLRARLHSYLSTRCQEFGCLALAVGGVADHVHLLVRLHPDVAVARLARELKAPSTGFVHRVFEREGFSWQNGYGAFTLRETESDVVRQYVLGQEKHHASGSVVDEWERTEEPWERPAP